MATVRYFVADVGRALAFYTEHLGFRLERDMRPAIAIVTRGDLTLLLSGPQSSGARPMPDGRRPEPGGWNRLVINVPDLEAAIAPLRKADLTFRNDIVTGPGGRQILLDDPDGNPIELFEAAATPP
jgi:catechol 2,3-dioxygenase-like lactoylglutathione lyase family enzyme